ncbi:MAG: biopolymer transporter ExbD [Gammaproteobacteria bacterium]|nr:biopolymer transporter ExbD [Gammaproteobacteria bacterium]
MSRRNNPRHKKKDPPELDVTTFLNLMVILIPFLLLTAVFTRVTILELNMPASAGGSSNKKPKIAVEVIVRKNKLQLANGRSVIANIPMLDDQYDVARLSELLQQLKEDYPEKEDATVLMEPNIEYRYLVQLMDAIRATDPPPTVEGEEKGQPTILFPDISIGDAP